MTTVDPQNPNKRVGATFQHVTRTPEQQQALLNSICTQMSQINDTLTQLHEETRRVITMRVPGTCERIREFFTNLLRYLGIIR